MRIFPVETEEITYHRRKHKAKRADILEAFTSEKVHHQLTGKDLLCPDCQKEMKEIGSWSVRQENDWQKMGLPVTRQDIINWQTKSTEYYFEPLYQLLKEKLLEQKFLHADETTYRVLESETVKTFYWTFLSDKQAKKQLLYIIMIHIPVVNWPKLP